MAGSTKSTLARLLKWLFFPLSVVFVAFPNLLKNLIFLVFRRKIKVLRPHCVFLINPSSGQYVGERLMKVLREQHREDCCMSLLENGVTEFLRRHIARVPKDERLLVVICGGDGSVSSVVANLESKQVDLDSCVFVPMPIGTGNDLSTMLNFGTKIGLDFLYDYFHRLNSTKTRVVKMDTWTLTYANETTGERLERNMLLYFGFGTDGRYMRTWDKMRNRFKFMFKINVASTEDRQVLFRTRVFLPVREGVGAREGQEAVPQRPPAHLRPPALPRPQRHRRRHRPERLQSGRRAGARVGPAARRLPLPPPGHRW